MEEVGQGEGSGCPVGPGQASGKSLWVEWWQLPCVMRLELSSSPMMANSQYLCVAQVGVSVSIQGSRMCSLWDGECICVCVCIHMRDISKGDKVNPSGDQCNPHPFLKGQSGLKQRLKQEEGRPPLGTSHQFLKKKKRRRRRRKQTNQKTIKKTTRQRKKRKREEIKVKENPRVRWEKHS